MRKDNTILMVGVGILAGYLLMPEKMRPGMPSGGGGFTAIFGGEKGGDGGGLLPAIPAFPGWGKLLPEVEIPNLPEVPPFPGWKDFLPNLPGIPDFIPSLPVKIPDFTEIIPEVPGIPEIIDAIKDIIPEEFPFVQLPGQKKTQRNVGGKWADFVAGWQDKQNYPTFFGKTLLDHLTSWFAPTGFAEVTPYAESVLEKAQSEQPTRSEDSYSAYEPPPKPEPTPTPEIVYHRPAETDTSVKTSHRTGSYVKPQRQASVFDFGREYFGVGGGH